MQHFWLISHWCGGKCAENCIWTTQQSAVKMAACILCASPTSEMLTRPSWKEQSLAFWVHMWRYLHQWHGNEPFTQERQLKQRDAKTPLGRGYLPSESSLHYLSYCIYTSLEGWRNKTGQTEVVSAGKTHMWKEEWVTSLCQVNWQIYAFHFVMIM